MTCVEAILRRWFESVFSSEPGFFSVSSREDGTLLARGRVQRRVLPSEFVYTFTLTPSAALKRRQRALKIRRKAKKRARQLRKEEAARHGR